MVLKLLFLFEYTYAYAYGASIICIYTGYCIGVAGVKTGYYATN